MMYEAFANPGTSGHVAGDLEKARDSFYEHRRALEDQFESARSEFEVQHRDLTDRIDMINAALAEYSQKQPQPEDVPMGMNQIRRSLKTRIDC